MNFLIVVDMQNDFISGSLGSAHAAAIVPNVVKKVSSFDGTVIYTRDTHGADYMHTQEGEKLPIIHCIRDTPGWEICPGFSLPMVRRFPGLSCADSVPTFA